MKDGYCGKPDMEPMTQVRLGRRVRVAGGVLTAALIALTAAGTARAQLKGGGGVLPVAPGEQVFGQACSKCHASAGAKSGPTGAATTGTNGVSRAPSEQTLEQMTPEAIYAAVTTGVMAPAAKSLTDQQKRELAEYLGGRPLDLANSGSAAKMENRCALGQFLVEPSAAA
jgi:polyvinyl alcohol dehydrogenase (cytochrome)